MEGTTRLGQQAGDVLSEADNDKKRCIYHRVSKWELKMRNKQEETKGSLRLLLHLIQLNQVKKAVTL